MFEQLIDPKKLAKMVEDEEKGLGQTFLRVKFDKSKSVPAFYDAMEYYKSKKGILGGAGEKIELGVNPPVDFLGGMGFIMFLTDEGEEFDWLSYKAIFFQKMCEAIDQGLLVQLVG
jgi:hypothetical protein